VESVRDEKQEAAEFSAGNLMLEEDVLYKRKGLLYFGQTILKLQIPL
jgi:hypothetical protein